MGLLLGYTVTIKQQQEPSVYIMQSSQVVSLIPSKSELLGPQLIPIKLGTSYFKREFHNYVFSYFGTIEGCKTYADYF
jgi:hypothetical protein